MTMNWRWVRRAVEELDVGTLGRILESSIDLNVNEVGPAGWTLLHIAVDAEVDVPLQEGRWGGRTSTVSAALLRAGADPTARLDDGRSVAELAIELGHVQFLSLIRTQRPSSCLDHS